jgi:hypothetical protein
MPPREALVQEIEEFGRIDAESELQLGEFFLRTDAYKRIEDQQHPVVVGRKGTGKTAIYKVLLQRASDLSNVHAAGLLFANYPWGAHADVQDTDAAPVERYSASWQFLILIELAKLALRNKDSIPAGEDVKKAASVLDKFIRTNWGQVNYKFKDTFKKRNYSFNFEPKFAGASLASLRVDQVARDRLAGFLTEANRWLMFCLGHVLSSDDWYFVLFDELDRGYDPADSEYADRLIGLILASRDVFQWADDSGLDVSPTLFLRSDIYEELSFPDKNKVSDNLVEPLTWTDDDEGENSLKALIDQRIRVIAGVDVDDPWTLVFDDQLMRGTQPKHKHMAARTYLRPRDMIKFGNLCLERAQQADDERITNRNIADARPSYSQYVVKELDDEIHEAVPQWKRYLDLLRRVHKLRFERSEFETAFDASKLGRLGVTPDEVLEVLYQFSVIGFTKAGGGGYGGSAVTFRYQEPSIAFDPGAKVLRVHLGLKEALDLVEAGDRG